MLIPKILDIPFVGISSKNISEWKIGVYKLSKKGGMAAVKVNGEKIESVILKDGDRIEVGKYGMTFKV